MIGGDEDDEYGEEEDDALRPKGASGGGGGEEEHQMWQIGEGDDDDEDGVDHFKKQDPSGGARTGQLTSSGNGDHPEQRALVPPEGAADDEFGDWEDGSRSPIRR